MIKLPVFLDLEAMEFLMGIGTLGAASKGVFLTLVKERLSLTPRVCTFVGLCGA